MKDILTELRRDINEVAIRVKSIRHADTGLISQDGKSEYIANVTLAYRHLEDARMRLGKAIQALEGGQSVYNK